MKKTFDCVEMKRKAQERIFEEIKDLTPEEELRYWQEREKAFFKGLNAAKARKRRRTITA